MWPRLWHHGLFALEQLLSPDCSCLLLWKELHNHIPSLSQAIPNWFVTIASILGVDISCTSGLRVAPPQSVIPVTPNPFYKAQLPFRLIAAKLGSFMIAFPVSYLDDGVTSWLG